MRGFAAKHLNVEIGLALGSDSWAGADYWEEQADPGLTLELLIERSEVITVGIDGGGLDDLMAVAVLGRDARTRDWLLWNGTWAHPIVLERRKSEAPRLQDFAASGELVIANKIGQDVEEIAELCASSIDTGKLAQIGLDPMGIGAVVDALDEKSIGGDRVVGVSQGWKLSQALSRPRRGSSPRAALYTPARQSWRGRSATPRSSRAAMRSRSQRRPPGPQKLIR